MSAELITKVGNPMTPGNFIALTKAALTDGILSGCAITASGANITVADGRMVAGGALVVITGTTVTASSAGELVLRIDSGAGTAEILVRQATTLTKQDITGTGTVYEMRLATFGFTNGAVSGLSIKIGTAAPKGTPNVYVQQSQPSSPQVGDLWLW